MSSLLQTQARADVTAVVIILLCRAFAECITVLTPYVAQCPDHTTTSAHSKTHPVFACVPNLSWYCCMLCSSQDFQIISSALLPRGHNDAQKTCWHEQGAMACLRAAKLFQSCLSVQISTLNCYRYSLPS